jgi:hypothetical protein
VAAKPGQIGQLVRTLGAQIKDAFRDAQEGLPGPDDHGRAHRAAVVAKVSRNAVAELVNQARNHPQRGDPRSASPAYAALAELTEITGMPGLALGLKNETGEISFLDLDLDPEEARLRGGAYVERRLNRNLWRQLKHLAALKVDRNMLGPSRPIRSPEDPDPDDPDEDDPDRPGQPEEASPARAADEK